MKKPTDAQTSCKKQYLAVGEVSDGTSTRVAVDVNFYLGSLFVQISNFSNIILNSHFFPL